MPDWTPRLGAITESNGTTFRVWAPEHERVELVIEQTPGIVGAALRRPAPDIRPLTRDSCGYWTGSFSDVGAGTLYRYRVEGDDERTFPDPASRFQPFGVHGPSQVVDPRAFMWTDASWRFAGRKHESSGELRADHLVFYELHVGTFTNHGTFRGVITRLPYLQSLGINTIELMPVADFPGDRNWGYDGVSLYAPARCYGTPDDLRALVDAAHRHGLAVCLDVVYNHLGPDGAYATAFSPYYFSGRHSSPWGAGINLDGPHSQHVRRFLIENAIHWVREYHIDALRLDATHALCDDGERHFLADFTHDVRAYGGRPVVIVAEDHRNLAHMMEPIEAGGLGLDGVWADDFHHQVRVHAAHDAEGYYADYSGTTEDLAATLRQGWFFQGQPSAHLGRPRGTDPSRLPLHRFIICIQNHDQIGNRADGARLNHEIDPAAYRALSTLLLLAPETPLLFMGQEWGASSPFLFFTHHHEELGRRVTQGRREEFRAFAAFSDPRTRAAIPDPQAQDTFARSVLCWSERECPPHAGVLRLYQRLLALRREMPTLSRADVDVRALDPHTVAMRLQSERPWLVVARLSGDAGEVTMAMDGLVDARQLLTTEDADVAQAPIPIGVDAGPRLRLWFKRPGAIVLALHLLPPR